MAEQVKPERKKLTITQVQEPKPVGDKGAIKLAFKAKDTEGKELAYFTFTKSIFEFIKTEAVIDGDVETSTREYEGNTYTDRKVTMIYQDGKPVAGAGERKFRGGYEDSPEKRASIERQSCLERAVELAIASHGEASTINTILSVAERFYQWVSGQTKVVFINEIPPIKPDTQQKGQPAPDKPPVSDSVKPCALTLDWLTEKLNFLKEKGDSLGDTDTFMAKANELLKTAFTKPAMMVKGLPEDKKKALVKAIEDKVKQYE